MNFKIKKGELTFLRDVLAMPNLVATESRIRTRFKKKILEKLKESEKERQILIDEYAIKDGKGKYKFIEGTNIIDMGGDENAILVANNVAELHEELCYIPCNEENQKMFEIVAKIMLEGDFKLNDIHADLHDEWCEQFEEIIEYYRENKEE